MKTLQDINSQLENLKAQKKTMVENILFVEALLNEQLSFQALSGRIELAYGKTTMFAFGDVDITADSITHFNAMYKLNFDADHPRAVDIRKAARIVKDLRKRSKDGCAIYNEIGAGW